MIYVLAFLALVMVACAIACWLADDTVETEPEPRHTIPAADQCAVTDCELPWQTHRHGWQLCHRHYRQHVQKDGAA